MINWSRPAPRDQFPGTDQEGVFVTLPDQAGTLAEIEARLTRRQGFTLATLNLDHVVKLRRNPAFRAAYARHDLVTADGNPIVWLSRLAGHRISLVPGSDLVGPVAGIAARHGVPVALFGSTEEALRAAAKALEDAHPGLRIVACLAPPMGFDPSGPEADRAIAELQAAGAQLCLVALGAPKQEIFAAHAAAAMPETGFVSIGAGLDFLAGRQVRAPGIMRMLALEWLWRLLGDPRRLAARYGACIAILPGLTLTALRSRSRGKKEEVA